MRRLRHQVDPAPVLKEARRQVVEGSSPGEFVQLVDAEPLTKAKAPEPPAPLQLPPFLVDGQPLFVVPSDGGAAAPPEGPRPTPHDDPTFDEMTDYVWDVYATGLAPRGGTGGTPTAKPTKHDPSMDEMNDYVWDVYVADAGCGGTAGVSEEEDPGMATLRLAGPSWLDREVADHGELVDVDDSQSEEEPNGGDSSSDEDLDKRFAVNGAWVDELELDGMD